MKKKKNYKRHNKTNKNTYRREKSFLLKTFTCLIIFVLCAAISKINSMYVNRIKTFISYTLEESTDLKKTENDIVEVFNKIKDKISTQNAVPVDSKKDDEVPLASEKKTNIIMNAYASSESEENSETKPVLMRNPADGVISSEYGERTHPVTGEVSFHNGIDIAGNRGDTIISAAPGTVKKTGNDKYNGKFVVIEHKDNLQTTYIHLDKVCVIDGENVDDNTKIGEMGDTGIATGVNLHFEIKHKGELVNPEEYITLPHKS